MKTVFFTGHRRYTIDSKIIYKLACLLCEFVDDGIVDFYAGGARGWDMSFENMVLSMRDKYFSFMKLHLVLPCPPDEQTEGWDIDEKEDYQRILKAADSVEIVSEHYNKNCMKKRNERLVELGDICLCYYNEKRIRSGTGQTVRLAQKQGKEIINLYTELTVGQ